MSVGVLITSYLEEEEDDEDGEEEEDDEDGEEEEDDEDGEEKEKGKVEKKKRTIMKKVETVMMRKKMINSLMMWGCLKSFMFWISRRILPTTSSIFIFSRFSTCNASTFLTTLLHTHQIDAVAACSGILQIRCIIFY